MKKKHKLLIYIVFLLSLPIFSLFGQQTRQGAGHDVTITVVDINNQPVVNAAVYANFGAKRVFTGVDGRAILSGVQPGEILVQAEALESVTFQYRKENEIKITLIKADAFSGEKDRVQLPYVVFPQRRIVGAVSVIGGENIENSNETNLNSAMVGQAAGLYAFKRPGEPGTYNTSLRVRGQSRGGGGDAPLVVVDGVPNRSLNNLFPSDIQSIQILKDPTTKIMYGPAATNGVLMVNTRKGEANKRIVQFNVDYGIKRPTVLPTYLNSYNYAILYDEARENDGFDKQYSLAQLEGYQAGTDPWLFPDVDYYGTFLKSQTHYQRVSAMFSGGTSDTRYFLNLGYSSEGGMEAMGRETNYHKLNVRANLDYEVNEFISADFNFGGNFEFWDTHNMSGSDFFNILSSHRPNEYPLYYEVLPVRDSMLLGYSVIVPVNLYGELTMAGFTKGINIAGQTDMGLRFNMDNMMKGLSASGRLSFDTYNGLTEGKNEQYPRYTEGFTRVGTRVTEAEMSRKSDDILRDFQVLGSFDYARSFDRSDLTSNLVFTALQRSMRGRNLDIKNTNLAYRINYMLDNKYVVEANASLMGSSKFAKGNRHAIFPAGGVAWIISEEDFLSGVSAIDFIKIKSSFGILGYDGAIDFLMWKDAYNFGSSYNFGINNAVSVPTMTLQRVGNENITFEKSREFNAGVEALLFNSLFIELNYFNEFRYDIPVQASILYPDYYGGPIPTVNFEEIKNHGLEISANFRNNIGDLKYSIGANITSSYAEYVTVDEINFYEWLNRAGTPTDAIRGYVSEGFYMSESEISEHGVISNLGTIRPGDLRYTDLTGDNIIDNQDRMVIGNSFPRLYYASNIRLNYKGIGLTVLGQGVSGLDNTMNNSYYRNYGEGKFSVESLNRWTPATATTATYPRLTTSSSTHSYTNSTFWLRDGRYFKLRNVELSYTFSERVMQNLFLKDTRVFARGTDLFSISKIENSDPEFIDAGVTNYPLFRTISFGIQLGF